MALIPATLISGLSSAFKAPAWAATANSFTNAVDAFVLSGTIQTTVTGVVTPPPPAAPFPSVGQGAGSPVTTAKAGLIAACTTAFASPSWAAVTNPVATAINTLVMTATVTTTVTGGLTGNGTGAIVPTGLAALTASMSVAFTTGQSWEQVANDIATAINTFLTTVIVNTTDSGVVPPASWVGAGVGSII